MLSIWTAFKDFLKVTHGYLSRKTMIQSIKHKVIALYSLLTIAAMSEIFLLKQNFDLKKKVNKTIDTEYLIPDLKSQLDAYRYIRSFEGNCLPFFPPHSTDNHKNSGSKDSRFYIIFCFTQTDCAYCLDNEIATWSEFNASLDPGICQVIGITDTVQANGYITKLFQSSQTRFPIFQFVDFHERMARFGIESTPAVFFGDGKSKKILYTFFPSTALLSKDGFAGKIETIIRVECDN